MQQTAVNVVLVIINETKLAFIQDESFYPSSDGSEGKGENNPLLFKFNTCLNGKIKCLKSRATIYASLEKE